MRLTNISYETLLLPNRMAPFGHGQPARLWNVELILTNAEGQLISMVGFRDTTGPTEKDFINLASTEEIEKSYSIERFYDLTPNTYTLQAIYTNQADSNQGHEWKGTVKSNSVTFKITP
jgi:hypothetical protein